MFFLFLGSTFFLFQILILHQEALQYVWPGNFCSILLGSSFPVFNWGIKLSSLHWSQTSHSSLVLASFWPLVALSAATFVSFGFDNVAAECLSQSPVNSVILGLDYDPLAVALCTWSDQAVEHSYSSLQIQVCTLWNLWLAASHSDIFVLSSRCLRHTLFDILHELSHLGVRGTQALVGDWYVWSQIRADMVSWCKSCCVSFI